MKFCFRWLLGCVGSVWGVLGSVKSVGCEQHCQDGRRGWQHEVLLQVTAGICGECVGSVGECVECEQHCKDGR